MAGEMASSQFVAGEMACSEDERDGDSATRSMSKPVNLILKPGKTKLPARTYFRFVLVVVVNQRIYRSLILFSISGNIFTDK